MITTIWKLFDVTYWQKVYHNKERLLWETWNNMLISSKWEDNWVYWFFDVENNFKAPFITVPSTWTVWQAFVQELDCSVDDNCLILIPKRDVKYDLSDLYSIAFQIRSNKWKYRYWRQITPARIKAQEIIIQDLKIDIEKRKKELLPKKKEKIAIKENKNIFNFNLVDICNIERKYSLYLNELDLTKEKIPYITTTEKDNWVSLFCWEDPCFDWKSLTVALDWSCWNTFFQFNDFIAWEKTAVITLKNYYNPYLLFYIWFLIKKLSWKFHYWRKLSIWRLKEFIIPIPIKQDLNLNLDNLNIYIKNWKLDELYKSFDLDYMEKIFKNSYWSELLEKYL